MGLIDKLVDNRHLYPIAVGYSLWFTVKAILGVDRKYKGYLFNLLYYGDILINALSGGNPDVTVSARVGHYYIHYGRKKSYSGFFWRSMRRVIDKVFELLDDYDHCVRVYYWTILEVTNKDGSRVRIQHGPAVIFIPMLVISTIFCSVMYVFLKFAKLVKLL